MSILNVLPAISILMLCFEHASGYVKDLNLFPYEESAGSTRFSFDDNGAAEVHLQRNFKFLNKLYSTVYVSGDGYITFGVEKDLLETDNPCNTSDLGGVPTAAIYMADADDHYDKLTAKLLYRQDTKNSSLEKISKDVFAAFPACKGNFTLDYMLILTWYNIPPYGKEKALVLRNTYQAILTSDKTSSYSFLIIYYSNITWPELTQKDNPARVGIYGGNDEDNLYVLPGSCTYSLLNIGETSNFNDQGKLAFRVDSRVELPGVSKCPKSRELASVMRNEPGCVIERYGQIQNLVGSTLIRVTCDFGLTSRNVTFECVELDNKSFQWISIDEPDLSLESCFSAENAEKRTLHYADDGDLSNLKDKGLILLSVANVVLIFVVIGFIAQRKYLKHKATLKDDEDGSDGTMEMDTGLVENVELEHHLNRPV